MSIRSKLNFQKLTMHLAENDVRVERTFIKNGEALFIEAITGKKEDHFFIHVSPKYQMPVKLSYKHINVQEATLNKNGSRFLSDMSQYFELDTALVTGKNITYNNITYSLFSADFENEEPSIIDKLEQQATSFIYKTNLSPQDTSPIDVTEVENSFLDFNGETIPRNSPYEIMTDFNQSEEEIGDDEQILDQDEWKLKETDLDIGQLYPVISLLDFFTDSSLLVKLISLVSRWYKDAYNKERDRRRLKFKQLAELQKNIIDHYHVVCKDYEKHEERILNATNKLDDILDSLYTQLDNDEATSILAKAQDERHKLNLRFLSSREKYNKYIDNTYKKLSLQLEDMQNTDYI